jgi:hypothetical protein
MTRTGRKQLSVQITEESFDQFNQLKEKFNLSNAKLVELLIQTSINTNINTNTQPLTEERLKVVLAEVLSSFSSQSEPVETEEEKEKKKVAALVAQYTDENGNFDTEATCTSIDTSPPIPEWDEQAWLDEDFIEFSNDPNPPEIIRTKPVEKAPIEDEDDDW